MGGRGLLVVGSFPNVFSAVRILSSVLRFVGAGTSQPRWSDWSRQPISKVPSSLLVCEAHPIIQRPPILCGVDGIASGAGGAASSGPSGRVDYERGFAETESPLHTRFVPVSDLACPFCARFHGTVQQLLDSQPDLSYTFVHFPGPRHPDARRMAIGAECAASEGRFFEFVHLAFEHQDSLGVLSESDVARQAGVPNLAAFEECLRQPEPISRVDAGLRLGKELALTGTPTVLVNGYRLPSLQRDSVLIVAVEAFRMGSDPWELPWWRRLPSWWPSRSASARAGSVTEALPQ